MQHFFAGTCGDRGRAAAGALRPLLLVALASCMLQTGAVARSSAPQDNQRPLDAHSRWERLSPEEQQRMRERFERYRSLSDDERRELDLRAQRMKENGQRLQRELSPEQQAQLSQLAPEKRRELLDDLLTSEAREIGRRVREQMPKELVERLETAAPEERTRLWLEYKRARREQAALEAIEHHGRRLELAADEIERLKALPAEERTRAAFELRKRVVERDMEQRGLPPDLSADEWASWRALPPREFFERLQRFRDEHGPLTGEPAARHHEGVPWTPPSPERTQALRQLDEAARWRPKDVLELADLPRVERQARLRAQRRERCIEVMRCAELAPPERLQELATAPDGRFFEVVHHMLEPLEHDRRSGWPARSGERAQHPPRDLDGGQRDESAPDAGRRQQR